MLRVRHQGRHILSYRLALSGFLDLTFKKSGMPYWLSSEYKKSRRLRRMREIYDHQQKAERALLRIRG